MGKSAGVVACELPQKALMQRYRESGAYTDCYRIEIDREVDFAQYINAFYTTWLFKLERWILAWAVKMPSTDLQVSQLANGEIERFAAWSLDQRGENQLIMKDFQQRTCSWFMLEPGSDNQAVCLYFGSAITRVSNPRSGKKSIGFVYQILLGFHKLYSRLLLRAAYKRLASAE